MSLTNRFVDKDLPTLSSLWYRSPFRYILVALFGLYISCITLKLPWNTVQHAFKGKNGVQNGHLNDGTTASRSIKRVLLLGETGSGKSTLGNTLLGREGAFEVGTTLHSCTEEITVGEGYLFGKSTSFCSVQISDTGGFGDTEGRDERFVDDIAEHVASIDGVHAVVYVHNACDARLSRQAQEALLTMVKTVTDETGRQEQLTKRLAVVMTQCTDSATRLRYQMKFSDILCEMYKLCNVPLFWYDDYEEIQTPPTNEDPPNLLSKTNVVFRNALRSGLSILPGFSAKNEDSVWRKQFETWVNELPGRPLQVPKKSTREKRKEAYFEAKRKKEEEMHHLKMQIIELEKKIGAQEDDVQELGALRNKLKLLEGESCFSPDSIVVDRYRGLVRMDELAVGSQVATDQGWSTVSSFIHWHRTEEVGALSIVHSQGTLTISPNHMVFIQHPNGEREAVAAQDLVEGESKLLLVEMDENPKEPFTFTPSAVMTIQPTIMKGYYAPLTSSGTILVDNVVASCYSQHDQYGLSHRMLDALAAPLKYISYLPLEGKLHPFVRIPLNLMDRFFFKTT